LLHDVEKLRLDPNRGITNTLTAACPALVAAVTAEVRVPGFPGRAQKWVSLTDQSMG
jgi:hypothetical protein